MQKSRERYGNICVIYPEKFVYLTISLVFYTEYYDANGKKMPNVDAILQAMGLTPEELELPQNADQKSLLIWYFDRYLPAAARKEYWGDDVRYYKLYTDNMNLKGEMKVLVTITSEAFGLLQLRNCGEKWKNIFVFKEQNGAKQKIPSKKNNPESKKYKAEWTDPKIGQVKYGGWNPQAIEYMNDIVEYLVKLRGDDAANNNKNAKYYKEILRVANEIKDDDPKKNKRKKKKSLDETPAPAPAPLTKIRRLQE